MMTLIIAYLIKVYNIPLSLVVNTDQTIIHLVPLDGDRIWEKKRSNDVGVIGGDDKNAIIACISSAADGSLLPLQLIFSGTTKRVITKTKR
jgi:hypothetical protein